jgi:hypothetical protein
MNSKRIPGHKLIADGPIDFLDEMAWGCECGGWSSRTPKLGAFADASSNGRLARLRQLHGQHAREAGSAQMLPTMAAVVDGQRAARGMA